MNQGKISELVLTRSVFKNITAKRKDVFHAQVGADASRVRCGDSQMVYKTSGVVDYTDKYNNYYTFYKCYNSMLAEQSVPVAMELNILLPMDAKEKDIKTIVKEFDFLCRQHGMEITGGNTQVTSTVNTIVTTVTMIGSSNKSTEPNLQMQEDKEISIIMTKAMGIEGTAIIAHDHEEMLRDRFNGRFVDECLKFREYISIEKEATAVSGLQDILMHDLSGTGVFGAIWELASRIGAGVEIDLKSIPVWQETIEVTELFDINPYKMTSMGSLLIATMEPEIVLNRLEEKEIPASVIGKMIPTNDKLLINNDEVRYLEPPRGDDIYLQRLDKQ